MVLMIHWAAFQSRHAYLGLRFQARRMRRLGLGMGVIALSLGGCVEFRIPDPNVIYVAFGDSSTSGPSTRDYPDILRSLLEFAPDTFANEGNSGETSEEGLVRLQGLLAEEIYPNADVLLYWEGGNDISEFIKDHDPFLLASPDDADYPHTNDLTLRLSQVQVNIESAVAAARKSGLRVYVATYYFLTDEITECDALPFSVILPSQARNANAYLALLNERIRAAAADQDAVLVDVAGANEALRQDPVNYFDCNHLSEQGNGIAANVFLQAIVGNGN